MISWWWKYKRLPEISSVEVKQCLAKTEKLKSLKSKCLKKSAAAEHGSLQEAINSSGSLTAKLTIAIMQENAFLFLAEEEEAARKAAEEARRKAEEARRKAEEERKAKEERERKERERQEALKAAQEAGDVQVRATQEMGPGWITCIASAYTIADNDPPGSTATASGIPLDESVPTVAMPASMNPAGFYGSAIEISYNGMSVVATVTDCGYMGGGSRGLDLTPAVFRAFGAESADEWGLRTVSYRFL